jgi:hypothetical protein
VHQQLANKRQRALTNKEFASFSIKELQSTISEGTEVPSVNKSRSSTAEACESLDQPLQSLARPQSHMFHTAGSDSAQQPAPKVTADGQEPNGSAVSNHCSTTIKITSMKLNDGSENGRGEENEAGQRW